MAAEALPGVSQHRTTGMTLICTDHHTDCPVHRVMHVPAVNPTLSSGFPISSHYRCPNLTVPTFTLLH